MLAQGPAQQLLHLLNLSADVDVSRPQGLLAREGEQAPRQVGAALGGCRDVAGDPVQLLVPRQPVGKVLRIAENDGEEIVEVMGHAAGELAHGFHLLGLAELLVEVRDGRALLLERLGGAVEQGHQSAQLAARMGRGNSGAEIAEPEFLRHVGEPPDLAPDAHGREDPYAGQQQQQGHREDRHVLVKPAICRRDQSVLGPSDQDVEAGITDRRRVGDGPDLRAAVAIGHFLKRLLIGSRREAEQVGSRNRRAHGRGPAASRGGDENGALAVDEQDILLGEQPLVVILGEFAQVERGEQHQLQRARLRSHRICDLEHRYSGQPAEYRLNHDAARDQGLLEIGAIPQIEGAVGPQRVAEQAAVRVDGQDSRELRVFLAHVRQKRRARRLVARVEVARPGQTVVKLRGALNLLAQIAGNVVGRGCQIGQGGVDFAAPVLHETQPDEARRHQHGRDDEYQ